MKSIFKNSMISLVASAFLIGCGGGDSSSSTNPSNTDNGGSDTQTTTVSG